MCWRGGEEWIFAYPRSPQTSKNLHKFCLSISQNWFYAA